MIRWLDRSPFTAIGLVWPGKVPEQRRGPAVPDGGDAVAFRVVTANALYPNRRPARWAEGVLALSADILCVQELAPRIASALDDAGGLPPHACTTVHPGSFGTGLWSRTPFDAAEIVDAGYAMVVARLASGMTVVSTHAVAPSSRGKTPLWRRSFELLQEVVDGVDGPVVVAGDLNATFAHGPLQELLARGRLRDAHVDAGRPRAHTWNARFPCALIDHVLVSEEIAVRAITEQRVPGSDHRAVVADLAIP